MKKIIISTFALAAVTVASANQKALVASSLNDGSEVKLENRLDFALQSKSMKLFNGYSLMKAADYSKMATAAKAAAATDMNVIYRYPTGTFFSVINIEAADGTLYTYPNSALLPAYADNVWRNMTWAKNAQGRPALMPQDAAAWNWETIVNDDVIDQANTYDYTKSTSASLSKGYGSDAPVLTANSKTYQYGSTGTNGQFIPQFFEYGGSAAASPEFLDMLSNALAAQVGANAIYTDGGVHPYNRSSDDFVTDYAGAAFGYPGTDEPIEVYFSEEGKEDITKVIGFYQTFGKPAAPYAISSLKMPAEITCQAGAKLQFTFASIEDNLINLDAPLYQYVYTIPEAIDGDFEIEIPFTSLNEIGDELDYLLVDKEMMMIVTGFTEEAISSFAPVYICDEYDRSYDYMSPEPMSIGAVTAVGEDLNFAESNYIIGFTLRTGGEVWCTYNSFAITMQLEYPYIKPFANLVTDEDLDPEAESTTVGLSLEAPEALLAVLCPGDVENVTFATEDGDDLPEWLSCEIVSAPDFEADENTGIPAEEGQKYFYLYFGLENEVPEAAKTNVVVEYKGQQAKFLVTTDVAGIDNVTAVEKAELDWNAPVYNVMGQKVSKGFTGIAIQNGNKFIVK